MGYSGMPHGQGSSHTRSQSKAKQGRRRCDQHHICRSKWDPGPTCYTRKGTTAYTQGDTGPNQKPKHTMKVGGDRPLHPGVLDAPEMSMAWEYQHTIGR